MKCDVEVINWRYMLMNLYSSAKARIYKLIYIVRMRDMAYIRFK